MSDRGPRVKLPVVGAIAAFTGVAWFLLQIVFELAILHGALVSAGAFVFLYLAARRGPYQLTIAVLAGLSIFVSLTCSLGKSYPGDSPIHVDVVLGPWAIFLLTALLTAAALGFYERKPVPGRFPPVLFAVFVVDWILLSLNVAHFQDWILENVLTVPFALLILLMHKWFRLSNISYGLIFAYMVLHIIGTHYTYSEVPFGFWLQNLLGLSRNHYDRIIHFSFGLLMAYPMREIAVRIGNIRGLWGLYVPIEFVLAFSAIYEILEWLIAIIFGGDLGIAYLGTQGDEWDAIKDMALAGLGAVIAMGVLFVALLILTRGAFWGELRESLRVKEHEPLGEQAIGRMRNRYPSEQSAP
jgi:putative membrane protein